MLKFVLRLVIVVIVLSLGLICLGPTIVSTEWGKTVFVDAMNRSTSCPIKVDRLRLSWLGSQEIVGFEMNKISFDELTTDATLFKILIHHDLGNMKLVAPKATLEAKFSEPVSLVLRAGLIPCINFRGTGKTVYYGNVTVEKGELYIDPVKFQNIELQIEFPKVGPIQLHGTGDTAQGHFEISGHANEDTFDAEANLANFPVKGLDQLAGHFNPKLKGMLLQSIGNNLDMQLKVRNAPNVFEAAIDATSPLFSAHAQTVMSDTDVTLKSPAEIHFTCPIAPFKGQPVDIKVDQFNLPLADKEAFGFQATITLPDTVLQLATDSYKAGKFHLNLLQSPFGPMQANLVQNNGIYNVDAKIGDGDFNMQAELQNGTVKAQGTLQNISTAFFGPKYSPFLGKSISLTFDAAGNENTQTAALKGSTELLGFDLKLRQTGKVIELTAPGKITYKISREELAQPAMLTLSLSQLRFPSTISDLSLVQMEGDLSVDQISFQGKTLNNLKAHLSQKNGPLSFDMNAAISPAGILTAKGTYDYKIQKAAFDLNAQQFPTAVLDLLGMNLPFSAFFGDSLNATAHAELLNWTGPLQLNVNSSNARLSLDGKLNQGVLTLNDKIYAQAKMTPALGKRLFNISAYTNDPMTLVIPAQGFSLPLYPLMKDQINIPNMRIELGKVYCQNEGNLSTTLSLLKLSISHELKVWFAPIDMHIQNGIADCERTEILLADSLDVCVWGKIDLPQNDVDMVLGLTASCLKKAFGVKNLPDNYVLQLPMTGPIGNVKIDTSSATTKIGAVLMWSQKAVSEALDKTPFGGLANSLLKKLGPLPDMGSSAPPPKHPFPWEVEGVKKKTSMDEPKKKKKHFRNDEKPLKQILKILK